MEDFSSKGLKVNLGKIKVMVSGGISIDGLSESKSYQCEIRSLRVKANTVVCLNMVCGFMVDVLV